MVKPGYKQTEVGVIPEDWEDEKLGELAKVCMCKRIFADQTTENGEIPFFKIGTFGKEADAYISRSLYEDFKHRFSFPQKGDVLISAAGTLGRSVIFDGKDAYFQDSNIVWLDIDKTKLCNEYLYHYYKVIQWASSEGSTIARLYNGIICDTHIALPKVDEQEQIAEALSEIDELISTLEKQVSKKKAIKQGVMQELLTGKRRLPGFSGKWISGKWKEVLDCFSSGATPYRGNPTFYKGSIKWVSSGELNYNHIIDTQEHISTEAKEKANLTIHPAGTFLMAITGLEAAGTRGSCAILDDPATTNQSCMAIYGTDKMSTEYLFHYYVQHGDELAFQYCQGTKQQSYTAAIVKELPIYYPEDVAEQNAIASVLTSMDNEARALKQKLAKYRQVKQGMMQQLLTGKIRLTKDIEDSMQAEQVISEKAMPLRPVHNHQFDDAVAIAAIVDAFYSDKYPLGRVKVQKLLYLLHRHQGVSVSDFKKKAAGPYADTVRYKGGEPIAKKNKYIVSESGKQGTRYSKGENMGQALDYVERWGMQADMQWLKENFLYTSRDDLELFATVDMAMCDLNEADIPVSVEAIKNLIASDKEWKAKLAKAFFSDRDIARAIRKCTELFS